jgi:hypothetical protein
MVLVLAPEFGLVSTFKVLGKEACLGNHQTEFRCQNWQSRLTIIKENSSYFGDNHQQLAEIKCTIHETTPSLTTLDPERKKSSQRTNLLRSLRDEKKPHGFCLMYS